jgi:hypothetical protein
MKATGASCRRALGSTSHALERWKAEEENEGQKWQRQAGGRLALGLQERLGYKGRRIAQIDVPSTR